MISEDLKVFSKEIKEILAWRNNATASTENVQLCGGGGSSVSGESEVSERERERERESS